MTPTEAIQPLDKRKQIVARMREMANMPGFPAESFDMFVRAYCRFVRGKVINHGDLGPTNDVDWLFDQIEDTCQYFPSPVKARRIYQEFFPPADGVVVPKEEE